MNNDENKFMLYHFLNQRLKTKGTHIEDNKEMTLDTFNQYFRTFNSAKENSHIKTLDEYNGKFLNFVYENLKRTEKPSRSNNTGTAANQKRKLINQNFKNESLFDSQYAQQSTGVNHIDNPYFQPQINKIGVSTQENFINGKQMLVDNTYDSSTSLPDTEYRRQKEYITSQECEPNKKFISNDKANSQFNFHDQFSEPEKIDFNQNISNCNVCEQNYYAIFNSRDRDVSKFLFHDNFQLDFSEPIKNIREIKCQHIILPNLNYFEYEPFIFLQIVEIDQLFTGSQNFYSSMFAKILPICVSPLQRFVTCFPAKTKKKYYNQPIASLSRLSFRLCTSTGAPLALPTDVFQIKRIDTAPHENNTVYKIALVNHGRNQTDCFYNWFKSVCHTCDPISITSLSEAKQQLYFLQFENYDSWDCPTIVVYASSLKITNRNLKFDDIINYSQLNTSTPPQNWLCSFNKISVTILLKFKILDINNNLIHSQIVK
jgi:hypothetical protein